MVGTGAIGKKLVIQTCVEWFGAVHKLFPKSAPDTSIDFIGVFKEKDLFINADQSQCMDIMNVETVKPTMVISKSWFEEKKYILPEKGDVIAVNIDNNKFIDYEVVGDASQVGNTEKIRLELMLKGKKSYA